MLIALIILGIIIIILAYLFYIAKIDSFKLKTEKAILEEKLFLLQNELQTKEKKCADDEERFKLLATQILSEKSDEIRHRNEIRLSEILTPFKNDLDKFGKTVNECYQAEARERFSLQEKIKDLVGVNQLLGKEAKELASALKGNNKIQGMWGELILENVLQKSGLRKNEEYFLQESKSSDSISTEQSRLRPDVIVRYPGAKSVVIDSKASLNAFVEYVNAEDDSLRQSWGLKHVESVRRHVDELAKKSYERLLGDDSADFVMMFIPNDSAYMAAMQLDAALWQKAYDKNIIIVSPTLLIGALRIIARQWDYDRQNRNAIEIATSAGRLYDKFVGFVEDLEKIENSINSLQKIYIESMKKLRDGNGSLISRVQKLREMGAKATKQLKSVEPSDQL